MSSDSGDFSQPDEAAPIKPSVYNRTFWLCCFANFAMVAGNALTFRFAELVAYLNGDEETTGQIVRMGVLGAIASRLVLGQLLDHYGTRRVWLLKHSHFRRRLLWLPGLSRYQLAHLRMPNRIRGGSCRHVDGHDSAYSEFGDP